MYLVLRGYVKGHRSEERVLDDWVPDERVTHVLGNCHGNIMAMSDFWAMAMGVPCYGHDHAMFAGINMVMGMPWSWPGHSQDRCHGESHDVRKSQSEGFVVGQRNELGRGQ